MIFPKIWRFLVLVWQFLPFHCSVWQIPQVFRLFLSNPVNNRCILIHATIFAFWSLVTNAITYLVKWSVRTKIFVMLGGWLSSMVVSMLVKSTWTSYRGAYAWIGHSRAFTTTPSNILQCLHPLTNAQQSSSIFGHQTSASVLVPMFFVDLGVWLLGAHH